MIGKTVAGRYEIEEVLGSGGMGTVYLARHIYMKNRVALKVMRPELQQDESFSKRFLKEVELASRVEHPGIVTIHDAGETGDGVLYMAMEYVEGEALGRVIERHPHGMPLAAVQLIARQVGEALEAVHAAGLIHRDLKPDNIMLIGEGPIGRKKVKLLDFGIAKALEGTQVTTRVGAVIGTPEYMSPEQAKGQKLDVRSDVYTFGLIVYSMLVGCGPFESDTPVGYLTKHILEPPPPLRARNPDIPAHIDAAVLRSLEKEKEDRFESAMSFVRSLEGAGSTPTMVLGGTLVIRSDRNCRIIVDGKEPYELKAGRARRVSVSAGRHTLSAEGMKGERWRETVTVGAGEEKSVAVRLKKDNRPLFARKLLWAVPVLAVMIGWWLWSNGNTPPEAYDDVANTVSGETVEEREGWAERLQAMETAYQEVLSQEVGSASVVVKIQRWEQFLVMYDEDDPYSDRDDELRRQANSRLNYWRAEVARPEQPETTAGTTNAPRYYENSIGMRFVRIESGEFMMGSEEGDDDEKPVHRVRISKPFWMGQYEVTQGQWEAVMGDNPSVFGGFDEKEEAVNSVPYRDVQAFIQRLNEREGGNRYRLPTEAEWEYAARAGSTTEYTFGDNESALGDYGWYISNIRAGSYPGVGQLLPNAWDLYDMHGNVKEWVSDRYDSDYYSSSPEEDPTGPGPSAGEQRVFRGGGWMCDSKKLRSASRDKAFPNNKGYDLGFRLLRTVE